MDILEVLLILSTIAQVRANVSLRTNDSVTVRTTYVQNASFIPTKYGVSMLPTTRTCFFGTDVSGFNPSITTLPSGIRHEILKLLLRIHHKNSVKLPAFLASFRQKGPLCAILAERHNRYLLRHRSRREFVTSLAILDKNFNVLLWVVDAQHNNKIWDFGREDVRLSSKGERILTTSMDYLEIGRHKYIDRWHLLWLNLHVNWTALVLTADVQPVEHPDIKNAPILKNHGRNMGVIWSGETKDPLYIQYWLGNYLDVRRGLPPLLSKNESGSTENTLVKGINNRTLHNNGNPIRLGDRCHGLLLAIGHIHIDRSMPSYKRHKHGATPYGNTYVHYLFFYEDRQPYKICGKSPAFCLPSPSDATVCQTIEFITGFIYLADTERVLITYGVNDCEAAYAIISLDALLQFTFGEEACSCEHAAAFSPHESPRAAEF